jgi:hypothetical protein
MLYPFELRALAKELEPFYPALIVACEGALNVSTFQNLGEKTIWGKS